MRRSVQRLARPTPSSISSHTMEKNNLIKLAERRHESLRKLPTSSIRRWRGRLLKQKVASRVGLVLESKSRSISAMAQIIEKWQYVLCFGGDLQPGCKLNESVLLEIYLLHAVYIFISRPRTCSRKESFLGTGSQRQV